MTSLFHVRSISLFTDYANIQSYMIRTADSEAK
jgi:hypothetical protein